MKIRELHARGTKRGLTKEEMRWMDMGCGSTCESDEGRSNEGRDEMDGLGEWEYMRLPNTLTMVATIWQLQRQHQRWQRRWYHHPSDYP